MTRKQQRLYMVCAMVQKRELSTGQTINMQWASGMVGVCPVFSNKKLAKRYAGKLQIVELSTGAA